MTKAGRVYGDDGRSEVLWRRLIKIADFVG